MSGLKLYDMNKAVEIVKAHVPSDLQEKEALLTRLDWCLNDIMYRAPEIQYVSWQYFEEALIEYVGVDTSIPWINSMATQLKLEVWCKE